MKVLEDKDLVGICVKELADKMGYADYRKLSQSDYEHLCHVIEEKTGILISLSTIKRIFNGKFERLPQTATLNALTQFIDYAGWQDYKTQKWLEPVHATEPVIVPASPVTPATTKKPKRLIGKTAGALTMVGVLSLVFWLFVKQKERPINDQLLAGVQFSAKKMLTEGVPNSVVFNYNIDHVPGDSFFIQQSWDPKRKIKIEKQNYTQTDIYYEPGYHKAKLISNDKMLKEVVVSIPTNDWIAYSKIYPGLPEYFKGPVIQHNRLGLTEQDLQQSGVDLTKKQEFFYAYFPEQLHATSDHFRLKARIRMNAQNAIQCPQILPIVYCQNSILFFANTIPGCISEISAMFSDAYLNGKTSDLSSLGHDITNWRDIEMQVENRKVTIVLEGKSVFTHTYSEPAGLIVGIGFASNGLCEVDDVELQDGGGKVVYRNDFNDQ